MNKKRIVLIVGLSILFLSLVVFIILGPGKFSREKTFSYVTVVFNDNKPIFEDAVRTGDFSSLLNVEGVRSVDDPGETKSNGWGIITVNMGGRGFGPATGYYGIFYSPKDNMSYARLSPCPGDEYLVPTEDGGFEYKGNDYYYVRPIEGHFYYYEAFY